MVISYFLCRVSLCVKHLSLFLCMYVFLDVVVCVGVCISDKAERLKCMRFGCKDPNKMWLWDIISIMSNYGKTMKHNKKY